MSFAQLLSMYLNMNFLIAIGALSLSVFSFLLRIGKLHISAKKELVLHYYIIIFILILTIVHPLIPKNEIFSPAVKIWSASSLKNFSETYVKTNNSGYLKLATAMETPSFEMDTMAIVCILLILFMVLVSGFIVFRDIQLLLKLNKNAFLVRKINGVGIFVSDIIQVPFSHWLPGQTNIIVPAALIENSTEYNIIIKHELQHHRQGDTRWVYVLWVLKCICILNPAIYFWNHWISEIQEFACDETLVDHKRVDSQAYARCLVKVAQTAIHQKYIPVCATGLILLMESKLLKRRIKKMLSKSSNQVAKSVTIGVGFLLASLIAIAAYASNGFIQDRRVNLSQATAMAVRAQSETGFPIIVNDLVLKQLNRYIGTPEGREFIRTSLARMENHKSVIGQHLQKYNLPEEIMAIPIVESGYQNFKQGQVSKTNTSAGIWQIIPPTARNYGLRVDHQKDERLDIALSSDAAMRYLLSNHLRFKDWLLSALSYNMGEAAVQKGMNVLNTRDVWTLIRNGYEGDKDYLAKLMAVILIMRNPESVD